MSVSGKKDTPLSEFILKKDCDSGTSISILDRKRLRLDLSLTGAGFLTMIHCLHLYTLYGKDPSSFINEYYILRQHNFN